MNSTFARNFTGHAYFNTTRIQLLKAEIGREQYISDFLKLPLDQDNLTNNENFRKHLFAHWLRNNTNDFESLKNRYKAFYAPTNLYYDSRHKPKEIEMIDPTNLVKLKELIGDSLMQVPANNTIYNLIVPRPVQNALFDNWEHKPNVSFLLWQFAKDMDISTMMMSDDGTKYFIIRPPAPPEQGTQANGYLYLPVGEFLLYSFMKIISIVNNKFFK